MSHEKSWGPFVLTSAEATQSLAALLAPLWPGGSVLLLQGELGAGKTCFAKGLIAAAAKLELDEIMSPTFTLAIEYPEAVPAIVHVDAYRLRAGVDLIDLGFEDWLAEGRRVLIEWPERVEDVLPEDRVWLRLTAVSENLRELRIVANRRSDLAAQIASIAAAAGAD